VRMIFGIVGIRFLLIDEIWVLGRIMMPFWLACEFCTCTYGSFFLPMKKKNHKEQNCTCNCKV